MTLFSTRMKIGIFLNSNESSGGTFQYNYSIYSILKGFVNDDFELVAFYTDEIWESRLTENVKSINVHFSWQFRLFYRAAVELNLRLGLLKRVFKYFSVVNKISKESCDFVIYPSQDFLSFLVDSPAVVAIHDLMHRYASHYSEYSKGEIRRRDYMYKLICQNSTLIFSDSDCGKAHIVESYLVNVNNILVLPFIPPTYFEDCHLIDLEKRYNVTDDFIFYPAAFWEHKNHKNLILAFSEILKQSPHLKLVLVGARKNYFNRTLDLINILGIEDSVLILNYVDNNTIYTLYKRCKLMVYVSLIGPTNIPPIEAIHLNCPFVCSNSYGMPEQVGECGLLVDATRPDDIREGIMKILDKDYNKQDMLEKYEVRRAELKGNFQEALNNVLIKFRNG